MEDHNEFGAQLKVIAAHCAWISLVVYLTPGLPARLVYDRQAILDGDLWRLGTACFVHFSASHLLWDLLVLSAAGFAIRARGYRGFPVVCCLAAFTPSIFLLLASPDIIRFGGLSGLATGGVAYLCLCEIARGERHRTLWWTMLALVGAKIAVETVFQVSLFAGEGTARFRVLPSVHAWGCAVALAVYAAIRPKAQSSTGHV